MEKLFFSTLLYCGKGPVILDMTVTFNGDGTVDFRFKDGNGVVVSYLSDGQKESERTYKDGKLMTIVVWKPNGEKCPVTNFVDGNGVVVVYNEDGTERVRLTYQDGKRVKD